MITNEFFLTALCHAIIWQTIRVSLLSSIGKFHPLASECSPFSNQIVTRLIRSPDPACRRLSGILLSARGDPHPFGRPQETSPPTQRPEFVQETRGLPSDPAVFHCLPARYTSIAAQVPRSCLQGIESLKSFHDADQPRFRHLPFGNQIVTELIRSRGPTGPDLSGT